MDKHFLGAFGHIDDVYKIYPYGGSYGDYILLNGTRIDWNDEQKRWGDDVSFEPVDGIETQTVEGNLNVTHDVNVGNEVIARIGRFGVLIAEKIELIGDPYAYKEHTHKLSEISDLYKYIGELSASNDINMISVWKELSEEDNSKQIDISHISEAIKTILKIVNSRISSLEESVNDRFGNEFLSKSKDDVSYGRPTFKKGIRAYGSEFNDGALFDKGSGVYGASLDCVGVSEAISSSKKVDDEIIEDFISGLFGHGWKISKKNGKYRLEIDDVVIRGSLSATEFVSEKIRSIKGALNISQGSEKIELIRETTAQYIFTIESDISSIMDDDFILCQTFGADKRMYHVKVVAVNGRDIYVDKTEFVGYSTPVCGDDIIQFGNETNKDRQSCIYLHADGDPSIDVLFNVDSKDWTNKTQISIGGNIPNGGGAKGLYVVNGMFLSQSEDGDILYRLSPDGSVNIGRGAIVFDPITNKMTLGENVKLMWNNLDDESKVNLKGDGNIIVQITSSEGTSFTNGIKTTLKAFVFDGVDDITDRLAKNTFSWKRTSGDKVGDVVWNELHVGFGCVLELTNEDVFRKAVFECEVELRE